MNISLCANLLKYGPVFAPQVNTFSGPVLAVNRLSFTTAVVEIIILMRNDYEVVFLRT